MKAARARIALAVAVALAALGLAILLSGGGDQGSSEPDLDRGELPAEAFVDSIGVVVHFNYVDTAYGRQATWSRAFASSGCATSGTPCPPRWSRWEPA